METILIKQIKFNAKKYLALITVCLLTSCGGGGGQSTTLVIDAGPDQQVSPGSLVRLSGMVIPASQSVLWSQVSGTSVTLSAAATTTITFVAPISTQAQTLIFRLTSTDTNGIASSDTVSIMVLAASVRADPQLSVSSKSITIALNSTALNTVATVSSGQITYVSANSQTVSIDSMTGVFTGLRAFSGFQPVPPILITVSQAQTTMHAAAIATFTVTVQPPPTTLVVNAGPDQQVSPGSLVRLSGTVIPASQSVLWSQVSGTSVTLSAAATTTITFVAPISTQAQTLVFRLTSTDTNGIASSDTVSIMVLAAVMRADPQLSVSSKSITIALNSTALNTVATVSSGQITYVSANSPTVSIDPNTGVFTGLRAFSGSQPPIQITVTQAQTTMHAAAIATFTVTVQPPPTTLVVNAGPDQQVSPGSLVRLSGTVIPASQSVLWSQVSGTSVALSAVATTTITFVAPISTQVQTLIFRLTSTDTNGIASSDTVSIMVLAAVMRADPQLSVSSKSITIALNSTALNTVATVSSGQITYVSADSQTVSIDSMTGVFTGLRTFIGSQPPIQITVSQAQTTMHAAAVATFTVTVQQPTATLVVDAGPDQQVIPGSLVRLSETVISNIPNIVQWSQVSGTIVSLSRIATAATTFIAPVSTRTQTLVFRVTATDLNGGSVSDTVSIIVLATVGDDPQLNVSSKTFNLTINSTALNTVATVSSGQITYFSANNQTVSIDPNTGVMTGLLAFSGFSLTQPTTPVQITVAQAQTTMHAAAVATFTVTVRFPILTNTLDLARCALYTAPNYMPQQWHLNNSDDTDVNPLNISCNNGASVCNGQGIHVRVVDAPVQISHCDLINNSNGDHYNFVTESTGVESSFDGNPSDSHGTAVAGLIAASANSVGVNGVAPNATIGSYNLLSSKAPGSTEVNTIISMTNTIISMTRNIANVAISNNSWGAFSPNIFVLPATEELALQTGLSQGRGGLGTIYIWAAGNSRGFFYGNDDGYVSNRFVIAVAALLRNGRFTSYSTPGSNLWISAPGGDLSCPSELMFTTDLEGTHGYNTEFSAMSSDLGHTDYTRCFNGTSSAAPVAAGVVALLLQHSPTLGWRDVREILARSAVQTDPTHSDWQTNMAGLTFNHDYGFGRIDAARAIAMASTWQNITTPMQTLVSTQSANLRIPEMNTAGVTSQLIIQNSTMTHIEQLEVIVDVVHTYPGDLTIVLSHTSGSQTTHSTLQITLPRIGMNLPRKKLISNAFFMEPANGTWTLNISDRATSDTGTIRGWTLNLYGR